MVSHARWWGVRFALLALLLRAALPAGFMPAAGDGFALTICTGHGALALGKAAPAQPGTDIHACGFAAAGAADAPPPLALAAPIVVTAEPARALPVGAIVPGPAAALPPSTGPPALPA